MIVSALTAVVWSVVLKLEPNLWVWVILVVALWGGTNLLTHYVVGRLLPDSASPLVVLAGAMCLQATLGLVGLLNNDARDGAWPVIRWGTVAVLASVPVLLVLVGWARYWDGRHH